VRVFRTPVAFTVVFPLTLRLFKKVPPETLGVYKSLSQWSGYKTIAGSNDWLTEGMEILKNATDEQYRTRPMETHTEITRREKTVLRQEMADEVMQRYLKGSDRVEISEVDFQRQIVEAKEETICDEEVRRWREEEMRLKAVAEENEKMRVAKERFKGLDYGMDVGLGYLGIVIAATAFAGAVFAIMKGYHYI
jgi:hypothetical protein